MNATDSARQLLAFLLRNGDAVADPIAIVVAAIGALALLAVVGSLAVRLLHLRSLARALEQLYESRAGAAREGVVEDLDRLLGGSRIAATWSEFQRRRHEVGAHAPEDRAPLRFSGILEEQPLIAHGVRRELLEALPGLLILFGAVGTLAALVTGLAAAAETGPGLAKAFGGALRSLFWGVALATIASFGARTLNGWARALTGQLDRLVERGYRSLTPGELSLRAARSQELGFERVSGLLVQVAEDLRSTLDRGLGRIEASTAAAASLVSDEQRRVLAVVTTELSGLMRNGVAEHVDSLRSSLARAAETQSHLSQQVVETVELVSAGSESNARVSGSLARAAEAVDEAAGTISSGASELKPLIEHLGYVAGALERTAARIEQASVLAAQAGSASAVPAYEVVQSEVTRLAERFVEIIEPLRESFARFDGSAGAIAQSVSAFSARAAALEARLANAAAPPAPSRSGAPSRSAAPAARAELVDVPPPEIEPAPPEPARERAPERAHPNAGSELAAALERSRVPDRDRDSGGRDGGVAPGRRAPGPTAATAAAGVDEGDRGGYSALLTRYNAPRFSIDELPPELRTFTADQALERLREAAIAKHDAVAQAPGANEAAPSTRAAEQDPDSDRGGRATDADTEVLEAEPPPVEASEAKRASDDPDARRREEERRRSRLERFFGNS